MVCYGTAVIFDLDRHGAFGGIAYVVNGVATPVIVMAASFVS
jgi:hypothetical protein